MTLPTPLSRPLNKTLLATTIAATIAATLAGHAAATESFNGKTMAMSGAGVANAHYSHGVILNPANAVRYHETDDFNLNLNVGAVGSDEDDLIDNADQLANQLDALGNLTTATDTAELAAINTTLENLKQAQANLVAGANITVGIPSKQVAAVFFVNVIGGIEAATLIAQSDIDQIDQLIQDIDNSNPNPGLDVDDLSSRVSATGLMMREIGISFGKEVDFRGQPIAVGITPKHQRVETIVYSETIANIDSDNFDADQFTVDDSHVNLDLGVSTHWERLFAGLSITNLISHDFATVDPSRSVTIEPQATAGVGYFTGWGNVAFDLDLNPIQYLGSGDDVQFAKLGAEVNIYRTVQLRVGYRHDLEDTLDDTLSLGFGLSPFDVVNLDIAAMKGGSDTLGVALQLGLSF